MSVEKAIEELKRCRGTQFDPVVVDAMFELFNAGRLLPHDHHHVAPPVNPAHPPHVHTY
jgi:HD-GYP domain-containing protein (c-di-GMP phosphodiesterase class II)